MANSVDLDQTAPIGAVCSGSCCLLLYLIRQTVGRGAEPVHIDVHLGVSLSCVLDISRTSGKIEFKY